MKIRDVLTANVVSTSLMTLFSEAVSKADGHTYNEAKILGELLNRITPLSKQQAQVAGWVGHYSVGVGFAAVYAAYLDKAKAKPTFLNGLTFGALSGLAGALIWHATFKAHPNPPGVNLKTYYKQLVLAHIVFGVSAAVVLKQIDKKA